MPEPIAPAASVRLQEVARAAGVSVITASRCISNPGRVARKTRDRVLEVAAELGYIPNRQAAGLASARSGVIAVVVPTIANPVHALVMQGVADVLEPAGYQLLLGNSHFSKANECELVRTFLGHRVDGLMLTGKDHSDACLEMLRRSGAPMVEMFDYNADPLDMNVGSSNFDAGAALCQYLLTRGRKRLAYVGHVGLDDGRMKARLEGMRAACAEADAAPPLHYEIATMPGIGAGGEVISTILREHPDVDAVAFAGHFVAVGAIRHALDLGIAVPGRVAVAGFGDTAVASWIRPSLTTVRFPVHETGLEAGKLMLNRLNGTQSAKQAIRLGFDIVARESA